MADNIWAVPLALSNFNIVVAFLGGFISLFGLVSYLLKENYYLSEARECSPRPMFISLLCVSLSLFVCLFLHFGGEVSHLSGMSLCELIRCLSSPHANAI